MVSSVLEELGTLVCVTTSKEKIDKYYKRHSHFDVNVVFLMPFFYYI
jgi:hypothetical protein